MLSASDLVLGILTALVLWHALFLFLHNVLVAVDSNETYKALEKHTTPKKTLISIKLVNIAHALVVGPLGASALWFTPAFHKILVAAVQFDSEVLSSELTKPVSDEDFSMATYLISLSIGFFVWDLAHVFYWEKMDTLMIVHHLGCILVWPFTLYLNLAIPWVLLFLSSELSSPFLQLRWFVREHFGPKHNALKINNLLFALSWLVVRTSTIPFCIYAYFFMAPWSSISSTWVAAIASLTLPLPSLLNITWTYQIIMMGLKDLGVIKSRNKKDK